MMSEAYSETLHASTVAIDGRAVMISGPSGSGKSDLALRLIDRGAVLVSDDYTVVMRRGAVLTASAPATIVGMIEVRGIGIIDMPVMVEAPVALLIILDDNVPRLPEATSTLIAGVLVPVLKIDAFTASAPMKVELALRHGVPA